MKEPPENLPENGWVTKNFSGQMKHQILSFISGAESDYIAARILYNEEQLIPASIMACTALEKLFKARLTYEGIKIKRNHKITEQFHESCHQLDHPLRMQINFEFLQVLENIYSYRYFGDAVPGTNITIIKNKHLAELDFVYSLLSNHLKISRTGADENEQDGNSPYNEHIKKNNYILNKVDKIFFVENTDTVMEYRVLLDYTPLLVQYDTRHSQCDGKFQYESLISPDDNSSATLTHKPFFPVVMEPSSLVKPETFKITVSTSNEFNPTMENMHLAISHYITKHKNFLNYKIIPQSCKYVTNTKKVEGLIVVYDVFNVPI